MRVIYESFDGKRFEDKKDCLVYEQAHCGTVKMWNEEGISDAESALVLYLGDENNAGGNRFIDMCDNVLAASSGIDKDLNNPTFGWWYWDDTSNMYRYISSYVRQALIHAYHDVSSNTFLESV